MRAGDAAWLAIVAYEVCCPKDELLSEALDRRLTRHPHRTRLFICYTALHCANCLPGWLDIYAGFAGHVTKIRQRAVTAKGGTSP